MTPYRSELEAALEALRRSWDVIDTYGQPGFYHGCAFLFDRPTGGFDEDVSFSEEYGDQRPGKIAREWLPDLERAIARAEEALRSPSSRPDFRASWAPPSPYSDAYDWHQYLDKPEEKASQPVNGPGTAVDSRSAACSSSSVPRSQPSGIVSSGAPTPSQATLSNDALQGPVATLHDDGCFTWKRDEFRLKYDRQRAGWRMDVYAYPPELKAPMAWDDRPLLAHCLEAVNAACSAWSDVRNLNGDIDGGKCAAAAALERIAKDRIKELAAQCASPPEPEKQAARRLTDEELFEQRVSWVFSCMNGLTKDQVRDILRNQLRPPSPPCGE